LQKDGQIRLKVQYKFQKRSFLGMDCIQKKRCFTCDAVASFAVIPARIRTGFFFIPRSHVRYHSGEIWQRS